MIPQMKVSYDEIEIQCLNLCTTARTLNSGIMIKLLSVPRILALLPGQPTSMSHFPADNPSMVISGVHDASSIVAQMDEFEALERGPRVKQELRRERSHRRVVPL